jgi:hypothetical protein
LQVEIFSATKIKNMKETKSKIPLKEPVKLPDDRSEQNDSTRLNTLSKKAIQEAFDFQKEKVGWDFYSEREFVENLFNQRFNYLIVMYSLFITAAATVSSNADLIIVLSLGVVMTILVSLTVYRAYVKMIITLKILHNLENHVFQIIDKEVKSIGKRSLFGVNQITGILIPAICIVTLIIGLICAILGLIGPE